MDRLLQRSQVMRENAELDYKKAGIDNAYLEDCCFNLQQCMELSLKHAIRTQSPDVLEGILSSHDICAHLDLLNSLGVFLPCEERLRLHADRITGWESAFAAGDDFTASMEEIDAARDCADDLLNCLVGYPNRDR